MASASASAAPAAAPSDVKVNLNVPAPGAERPEVNPEATASCLSRTFFSYVSPFVRLANKRNLEPEDVWPIHDQDRADKLNPRMQALWDEQRKLPQPSLFKVVTSFIGWRFATLFLYEGLFRAVALLPPVLLEAIVLFVQDPAAPIENGIILAVALLLVPAAQAMLSSQNFHVTMRLWVQLRSAVSTMVYRKTLRVRTGTKDEEFSTGNTTNLMSADAEKVGMMALGFKEAWLVPIQIIAILIMIHDALGPAMWVGLGIMLVMLPLMGCVIGKIIAYERTRLGLSDSRVKVQSEILMGIRVVKFYAWERSFMGRLQETRDKELDVMLRKNLVNSGIIIMFMLLPVAVSLGTFATYVGLGNEMHPAVVFKALSLFVALRFPLIALPSSFSTILSGMVSVRRIERYLNQEEVETPDVAMPDGVDIVFDKATFVWSPAELEDSKEGDDGDGAGDAKGKGDAKGADKPKTGGKKPKPSGAAEAKAGDAAAEGAAAEGDDEDEGPLGPTLDSVSFEVPSGSLTAVVGTVGSGKSSLFGCLLGEMKHVSGVAKVRADKRLAYIAQSAWIQNMSVRNNILFGRKYDTERYNKCIKAAGLEQDLDQLPGGDLTEIGDRGINLSGGQKQRVAIARAIYEKPEIIFYDDPLSAVDANVGQHIFMNCIKGELLEGSTRLFVTNQLHLVPLCDNVIVLLDGKVKYNDTYTNLIDAGVDLADLLDEDEEDAEADGVDGVEANGQDGTLDDVLAEARGVDEYVTAASSEPGVEEYMVRHRSLSHASATGPANAAALEAAAGGDSATRRRQSSVGSRSRGRSRGRSRARSRARTRQSSGASATETDDVKREIKGKLTAEEERAKGAVSRAVYWQHFGAMGGAGTAAAAFVTVITAQLCFIGSDYWLAFWTNGTDPLGLSDAEKPDNDFYITGLVFISIAAALLMLARELVFAVGSVRASRAHHETLQTAIMSATPRFFDKTPLGRILNRFSKDIDAIDSILPSLLTNTASVFVLVLGNLIAVALTLPVFLVAVVLVGSVLYYVQLIYKQAAIGMQRIESTSRSPLYSHFTETIGGASTIRAFNGGNRFADENRIKVDTNAQAFFQMRLVFRWAVLRIELLNSVSSFACALLVVLARDTIDPAIAGAALNFATSIGGILGFVIILSTELEVKMNAVERVMEYQNGVDAEPAWELPTDPKPGEWPTEGKIEFRNVHMAYREDLEPALRGLTITIKGGQKCGVVGRTGSGKSTTMLSLFRMYPLSGGDITIDGRDISSLGLHALRRNIAIVPQDPVLFSGTIRDNLDPFGDHKDDELWATLRAITLDKAVTTLDDEVKEYGSNYSVGQRQLLCMGRALLKKPKILVMDEATSSIDQATDDLIQTMVRTQFADATILAIAHRLNTIIDSDVILVLDNGVLMEHGNDAELTAQNGLFAKLKTSSGH